MKGMYDYQLAEFETVFGQGILDLGLIFGQLSSHFFCRCAAPYTSHDWSLLLSACRSAVLQSDAVFTFLRFLFFTSSGAVCVISYDFWSAHPEESLRLGERYLTGVNSHVYNKNGTRSARDVWSFSAPQPRSPNDPSRTSLRAHSGTKLTVR